MKSPFLRAAGMALLPLSLSACMAPAPFVDAHLGEASRDLRTAQVLNPAADRNMQAPTGMAASTAKAGYDQYQKSFKTPDQRNNTFVIGLGR